MEQVGFECRVRGGRSCHCLVTFCSCSSIGLPLIAIIFWFEVGSGLLLLFPAVATGCALILSYGAGYLLATLTDLAIPSYQADIMLFLALALAIDYSFFLLTRLQEERQRLQSNEEKRMTAVEEMAVAASSMMKHSGEIVLTSGSILVVTWLALGFFPVYGLDAIGYCSAITVCLCIAVNLVLTPALLLLMANCCLGKHAGFRMCGCCGCCSPTYRQEAYSKLSRSSRSRWTSEFADMESGAPKKALSEVRRGYCVR